MADRHRALVNQSPPSKLGRKGRKGGGRVGVVLEFTFLTAAKKRRVMEIAKVNGAISAYQTASLSSLRLSAGERVGDSRGALFKTRGPQKNPGVFRVCAHTRAVSIRRRAQPQPGMKRSRAASARKVQPIILFSAIKHGLSPR